MNHNWPSFIKDCKGGDCLILAGDIINAILLDPTRTDQYARKAQKKMLKLYELWLDKYDHVLYIMGNHEHYGGVIYDTKNILVSFFKKHNMSNVYVLENGAYQLTPDWCVLGATLWTDMNKGDPIAEIDVQNGMNDYHVIYTRKLENGEWPRTTAPPNVLRCHHTMEIHRVSQDWIFSYCKRFKNVIVATHHAPSYQSEGTRTSNLTAGYCSNLERLILENPNIKYWIHGHTHNNIHYKIGETQVTSAMYGYQTYEPYLVNNFIIGSITK